MIKNFIIVICVSFFSTTQLKAQKGTIVYNQTINLHKNLSAEQQMYKALVPETITKTFHFSYNEKQGKCYPVESKEQGGVAFVMQGQGSDYSCDFTNETYRRYVEVEGEMFHCEMPIKKSDVKETGKSKKILGYSCREYKINGKEYSFWVTTELPKYITPIEPYFFEGAVLELQGENFSFLAVDIMDKIDDSTFAHVNSRSVTKQQYEDLKEEEMSELKEMESLDGKVMK